MCVIFLGCGVVLMCHLDFCRQAVWIVESCSGHRRVSCKPGLNSRKPAGLWLLHMSYCWLHPLS